jgi:hypothetical protein
MEDITLTNTISMIGLAIALASVCGIRAFSPILIVSILSKIGFIPLQSDFEWLSSTSALIILSIATLIEIIAYFFPWVDSVLSAISTIVTPVAGIIVSCAVLDGFDPTFRWVFAVVAGGGISEGVALIKMGIHFIVDVFTAGIAAPILSFIENIVAICSSILAFLIPILTALFLLILITIGAIIVLLLLKKAVKKKSQKSASYV